MANVSRFIQILFSVLAAVGAVAVSVSAQQASNGILSNIPGAQTASKIMASSVDGMSRYLAPDGPIQPALTAIGGLPVRGIEMANNGISRISSGLSNGAQSLSKSAGDNGNIRMPGLDTLESSMPASFARMGEMMHGAIQQKNKFIMGQAEKGIQAGQRLQKMMQGGLQGMQAKSSGSNPMVKMSNMMGGAQDAMMKGKEQIKGQLKQSLEGTMGRMKTVQSMGDNMRDSAQGIRMTLVDGLQGAMSQLQRTKQQVSQQLQGGMEKNMGAMSNIMGSMQGSMGNMQQNMHKNLEGAMRHAQNAAQQVTSSIQEVAMKPMEMMNRLGEGLGKMMQGGMQHSSSSGGRY